MNTITFIPSIIGGLIGVDIFIDDKPIDLEKVTHIVPDLGCIRYSLENLGNYECPIYTCSCGDAGCGGIEMQVLANTSTIAWKMSAPLQFFYLFDYEHYADAFETYQKGLRHLLEVCRVICTDRPEYVKWLLKPL